MISLDLDGPALTQAICDIESVSGNEGPLADAIEEALTPYAHLHVERIGHTVVARTQQRRAERVVVAGHIDTVPVARNLPTRLLEGVLWGRGTCDMKGGVAVGLRLAAHVPAPVRDVTYVFYESEEVNAEQNGLAVLTRVRPDLLDGDFAVLMEPTAAQVEGGCQGTMRVDVTTRGTAAHSARAWMGHNAIHDLAPVLAALRAYEPRQVDVDGLSYREGLNAVAVTGGIAGNVIPDRATLTVNFRFAPDRSEADAQAYVHDMLGLDGLDVTVVDTAPGARPGLTHPAAAAFVAAVGGQARAKLGWTDVARFSAVGVPAVNYGPGDPSLAHHDDERVDIAEIVVCEERMAAWLNSG